MDVIGCYFVQAPPRACRYLPGFSWENLEEERALAKQTNHDLFLSTYKQSKKTLEQFRHQHLGYSEKVNLDSMKGNRRQGASGQTQEVDAPAESAAPQPVKKPATVKRSRSLLA
eukprot:gene4597-4807_t